MSIARITTKLATVGGPKVQLVVAKVVKYSPQILTGVGIVGGIGATILIARGTLKLEGFVDNFEQGKEVIRTKTHEGAYASKRERSKDLSYLYFHSGIDLVKIYGPGVALGGASIFALIAGQGISQKRQVSLVAAVKAGETAFAAYRARVVEAIGEEKEAEIRYGITTETIEDENGKKTKVKTFNPNGLSPYVRNFDSSNKNWEKGNRELNYLFLKNMQNWANDRLNARGYVYLNEVLEWLGFKPVPEGQVVGWLHKDLNNGDGYVDFGWENILNGTRNKIFPGGETEGIILDFNVDGEINSKL